MTAFKFIGNANAVLQSGYDKVRLYLKNEDVVNGLCTSTKTAPSKYLK
jgi:hypothetical protein